MALKDLTVAQLRENAKQKGLTFTSKTKKDELVALLEGKKSEGDKKVEKAKTKASYTGEH
jgi:hypothetical protein